MAPNASILKRSLTALQSAQALFGDYLKLRPSDIDAQLGLWRAQIMSGRVYFYLDQKPRSIGVSTENLYKARIDRFTAPTPFLAGNLLVARASSKRA